MDWAWASSCSSGLGLGLGQLVKARFGPEPGLGLQFWSRAMLECSLGWPDPITPKEERPHKWKCVTNLGYVRSNPMQSSENCHSLPLRFSSFSLCCKETELGNSPRPSQIIGQIKYPSTPFFYFISFSFIEFRIGFWQVHFEYLPI